MSRPAADPAPALDERTRIHVIFGVFLVVLVLLLVRLAWLQLGQADPARGKVERQQTRFERLPAQRGAIVDRDERVLACDREVLEIRAEMTMRIEDQDQPGLPLDRARPWIEEVVQALARDPELGAKKRLETCQRWRERLLERVGGARPDPKADVPIRGAGKPVWRRRIDFLVAPDVTSAAVVDALLALERRDGSPLRFQQIPRMKRSYPDREVTIGPLGFISDGDLLPDGSPRYVHGMEALEGLVPGLSGLRAIDRDARANDYWTLHWRAPESPKVVHTTLDLDLQKAAQELLTDACKHVEDKYQSGPDWGSLMLIEIASGNVLAMASWRAGADPRAASFSPTQCVYEPGSVVKPLVFALALERGVLSPDDQIDCSPNRSGGSYQVPGRKNTIHDVHVTQGRITPREVLIRSSNIGALQVGMRLGRDGLESYLQHAGFGVRTGLGLPGERQGLRPKPLSGIPDRGFLPYTGPSISIGYEIQATPAQVARAFLTLLSGRPRELRLYSKVDLDGRSLDVPAADAGSQRYLSDKTIAWTVRAMADVVSDEPHATGLTLFEELKKLGIGRGLIGGKTGTSEYPGRVASIRSATFAGFAPVVDPRYLVVCVVQKEGARLFYGGKYAAPAAGRLLLRALAEERSDRQRVEARVSVISTDRGGQASIEIQGGR
jgi:cell division protein FtsI/penicillin-binding protein 2